MAKTMNKIVQELRTLGHDIRIYKRKDGGLLIRSIDGMKFTGAEGNKIARGILGETLSEKRSSQLQKITPKTFRSLYGEDIEKSFEKVQRKWRKANLPHSAGKLTKKKFKAVAKSEGLEEALKYLSEKEKYATGYAYSKNVEILAQKVESLADIIGEDSLYELAEDIRINGNSIREEWIVPAYDELYRLNNEPMTDELVDDVINNTRRILHL